MSVGILYDSRKSPTRFVNDLVAIDLDVMISEAHEWTNEVTSNPVELGSPVTDHIQPNADKLSISGMISDSPIDQSVIDQFQGNIDGGLYSARLQTHFDWLYFLARNREPIIVYTRYKSYPNMAIASLNLPRDAGLGEALQFNIEFVNIRLVSTQTVPVPAGISKKLDKKSGGDVQKKAQPKADNGKKDVKPVTEKKVEQLKSTAKVTGQAAIDAFLNLVGK